MNQLAPAAVVFTTSLATSPWERVRRHEQIVAAAPRRGVGRAPTELDKVTRGVGIRLAVWTVGANDNGGTRLDEVRHVSRPMWPVEMLII